MRKLHPFILAAALFAPAAAEAAVINAVSGNISYQGRLEKDSAPVSGKVLMYFRVYGTNSAGETVCLWGPATNNVCSCQTCTGNVEQQVTVVQGLFGVNLTPPPSVFYNANEKTLEIQVGDTVLSPREPLQAVPYAFVSKRLEDNSDIAANTLTAANDVAFSTVSGSVATLGSPSYITTDLAKLKLNVYGVTRLNGDLYVNDVLFTRGDTSSIGSIAAQQQATIKSNTATTPLGGDIVLYNRDNERMRIVNDTGYVGLGSASPQEVLEVNGNITNTSGNFGIFPQEVLTVRPKGSTLGGVIRVMPKNSSQQTASVELYSKVDSTGGVVDPTVYTRGSLLMNTSVLQINADSVGTSVSPSIAFNLNGTTRMSIPLTGTIDVPTGITAGNVKVTGSAVDAADLGTLSLQTQTSALFPSAVVVGDPTNTIEVNKMSVYGGMVVSQKLTAANADFGTDTTHGGLTITKDSGANVTHIVAGDRTNVSLSSTTIWGDSEVNGNFNVTGDFSIKGEKVASQVGANTFTSSNTFQNDVFIGTDTMRVFGYTSKPAGFPNNATYNIGGAPNLDSRLYLIGGAGDGSIGTADAQMFLYRGFSSGDMVPAASIKTNQGKNMQFVVNGSTRTYFTSSGGTHFFLNNYFPSTSIDSSSDLLISTGSDRPALYINSATGKIAMGTNDVGGIGTNTDPILTVNGDLRLKSGVIVFPNGSTMGSSGTYSSGGVATVGDASIQCSAPVGSSVCSLLFKTDSTNGLTVKTFSGGMSYVGVGTADPLEQLHVRIGNVMVGNLGSSSISDRLSNIAVAGSAYLALDNSRTTRVGIGIATPTEKLDVGGNIQLTQNSASIIFNGTGPHYIYVPAGADLSIATTTGKVGIGLTSPAQKLDVSGNIQLTQNSARLVFNGTGPHSIYVPAGADLAIATTTGKVGIGTTTPTKKLDVTGDIQISTDNASFIFSGTGTHQITTAANNNDLLILTGTGNIGIGKTGPTAKLDVAGTLTTTGVLTVPSAVVTGSGISLSQAASSVAFTGGAGSISTTSNGNLSLLANGTGNIQIQANSSSAGELKVSYTSTSPAGYYAVYAP